MAEKSLRFDLVGRDKSLGRTLKQGERDFDRFGRTTRRSSERAGDEAGRRFGMRFSKRLGGGLSATTSTFNRFSAEISKVALVAGGAAAGLTALGVGAAKLEAEWGDATDTIRTGTGKTGKALAGLTKDFNAVATSVPTSLQDAGTAIAELNRRTGQTGKGLQDLARREIALARVTKTDLGTNIAATTRLFRDWSIPTAKQADTLDMLFRAAQATGIGVDKLAQSVVQFGSPLRQLGLSFKTTTALFSEFERAGVVTETVLPGLRMALKSFALAGKEPAPALIATIKAIKEAGSTAAANTLAFKTFGVRAGPDLAAAIREGHFDLDALIKTIAGGHDTIMAAEKDTEGFTEAWQKFTNFLKVNLGPSITAVFDAAGKKIDAFAKFVSEDLAPKLFKVRDAWDANKDSIAALLTSFDGVNDKSKTADERAQSLADSLASATEGVGKIARGLKTLGDGINGVNERFQAAGEGIHVHFVRPVAQDLLGLTRFALGQWRALAGGAATLVEHMPGGKNSGLGKALRTAEQQLGALEAGAQREFNDINSLSSNVAAKAPGGSRSGFNRSLVRAGKGAKDFRAEWDRQIGGLHGKTVNVKARAAVEIAASTRMYLKAAQVPGFHAEGGPIRGPGTGTSDSVPAMLSTGEHVWTAAEVRKAGGHSAVERMRRDVRGYAAGGPVVEARFSASKVPNLANQFGTPTTTATRNLGQRVAAGMAKEIGRGLSKAIASLALTGGSGAGFGSGSWMRAIRELQRERVPYSIVSTFRRGAVTHASGRQSYHALNRAVDLDGGHDKLRIWRALTDTSPTELIYSRAPLYKSRSGWHPISRLDPITRADHYSHVHAAYDRGGYLMPGTTVATNSTGKPERILGPDEQVIDYRRLGQEVARALAGVQLVVKPENLVTGLRAHKRTLGGQALGLS